MEAEEVRAAVLRPVPLHETPAFVTLLVAWPLVTLSLAGAALRVVVRTSRDGMGASAGVLIVVLLLAVPLAALVRHRSRRARLLLRYDGHRISYTDARSNTHTLTLRRADKHLVRGLTEADRELLVLIGDPGEPSILIQPDDWDYPALIDQVLRPSGARLDLWASRRTPVRRLRELHPGLRVPFTAAHPLMAALLIPLLIVVVIGGVAALTW
ncbi:hypothetical protein PUR34_30535 [Streptomyces sp. JV185]|uniref:hypothetical protein n=1 Tax=Streptomyces sp. JV185 TaxID=858638 RepID=UPI002E7699A6|nr:hypothetical protein [Streptomyces sp. JV185]MEE1772387.1 hypothetical protein [Streptomyces sp. JV185]